MAAIKMLNQNINDQIIDQPINYNIQMQPHQQTQLYECELSFQGEFVKIFACQKISNKVINMPLEINIDYSNAVRELYMAIKDSNVGADQGEWQVLNNLGNEAFVNSGERERSEVFSKFLAGLSTKLWTDGNDHAAWTTLKNAAFIALKEKEPVNQFLVFCSQAKNINNPSHNDWAWAKITEVAKKYAFNYY